QGEFSISVTDDQLIKSSGIEPGNLIAGLYLEPDIFGSVADPSEYFDPANPMAAQNLDLLLMTRGWRHFTWEEIKSGQKPLLTYDPEKAVIEGYVYSDTLPNRIKNLKIFVDGTEYKVKTDKNGYFRLEGIDLSEEKLITFKDVNNQISTYLLTEYTDSLKIDIAKNYEFLVGGKAVIENDPDEVFAVSSGSACIKGQITDVKTGEPLPFATVSAEANGNIISGTMCDEDGFYTLKPLPPGKVDIKASFSGYPPYGITNVVLKSQKIIYLDIEMDNLSKITEKMVIVKDHIENDENNNRIAISSENTKNDWFNLLAIDPGYLHNSHHEFDDHSIVVKREKIEEIQSSIDLPEVIVSYEEPIIDIDVTANSYTIPPEVIRTSPRKTTEGMVTMAGGVFSEDGEVGSVRGARPDQTIYYVDGIRMIGDNNVPSMGIAEINVILGGIPAEYGDCRGGVVQITTKGPNMFLDFQPRVKPKEIINLPEIPVYRRSREFPVYAKAANDSVSAGSPTGTVYWNANIIFDEQGKSNVSIPLPGIKTFYRIIAEGIGNDGTPCHSAISVIAD
ncbi:MAG: TonB-dependent receptor, partial [Bacteroidales bacterium]|nr:TonB-dependent receptor [Bacteroidales bacterium]